MEFATGDLVTRVLLTILVIGGNFVPPLVDFNKTHATNPLWTPHARFHVVWQMSSYAIIGVIVLGLIWIGGPTAEMRLWLAILLIAATNVAFYIAALTRPMYGGMLADTNGVPPIGKVNIGGRAIELDANMSIFGSLSIVLIVAIVFAL